MYVLFFGEKFAFGHKKVRAGSVVGFFGGFPENGQPSQRLWPASGGAGGWAREVLQPPIKE
ncbi:hypothetical protein A3J34_04705 [Candidatus Peribacteria bacterium RIFCSPLOWO2_02_FULL_51_10]|nr:MAG: hypothetical protein A3C52_03995 [Candidatus Peribacteria bacterium RIFCSPHIGHO2_02_FULL_51_15]OGJ68456.1 MAG: hypothetical protein A3J34_04705 [Candidatus Peribacteria bacterium RIFCSPLOWO2_02_FULL_51_10]